jgi:pimeloyl-ACP methyl ester carboxylesterase
MRYVHRFHQWLKTEGYSFEESSYARSGGKAQVFLAKAKTVGPVAVVLHSTGCDKYTPLVHLYRMLLEQGISIFAFDLDGHGVASTHVLDTEALIKGGVKSMVEAGLDAAHSKLDFEEIILIGQSLGGSIALDYVLGPTKIPVTKLVCLATPILIEQQLISFLKEATSLWHPSVWGNLKNFGLEGTIPAIGNFRRDVFPIRVAKGRGYAQGVINLINSFNLKERIKDLRTPCFWMHAHWDSIAQGTPPPGATVVNLGRESHFSSLYTDRYFDQLRNFVRND